MLLTLALVTLFGSIAVFFSQEFIRTFEKLFAIKGIKLFLPLFAASWVVYTYNVWILWGMSYIHLLLHSASNTLVDIMPFKQGAESVVLLVLLTSVSVLPVCVIEIFTRRRSYEGFKYSYVMSAIIWIVSVILLIVL